MELFRQAAVALRRNTFRSCLTILGIVWGITAVCMLQSYGDGFHSAVVRSFDSFGPDVMLLQPGQTSQQAGGERAGRRVRLTMDDVEWIREEATLVRQVSPEILRSVQIANGPRLTAAGLRAVHPCYGLIRNEVATSGRFLNEDDLRERRRVIFLGSEIRRKLFGNADPVGQTVTLHKARFTVVGWMDKKLNMSSYFRPDDESVFIPLTAATDLWQTRYLDLILFEPLERGLWRPTIEQVRGILARHHHFSPKDERAVRIMSREEFRPIIDGITLGIQLLLTVIGGLTLGIGGVGVMNIMLVSVTERTREIGVRMAVGATRRQIRIQFLLEALAIVAIGGVIGLGLAWLVIHSVGIIPLLGHIFEDDSGRADIHMKLSLAATLRSIGLLAVVGVLSGLLPAIKASRLNPIEALRYE